MRFAEAHHRLAPYGNARFMVPMWEKFNKQLEAALLPTPPFDFLNDPIISGTMFLNAGGTLLEHERRFVEDRIPSEKLAGVLQEDYVGVPALHDARYVTSHNSIHHLYLLLRFFGSTATRPAGIGRVIEWGGGYGDLAKIFLRLREQPTTYILIDTPLMASLQWLYLSTVLGPESVHVLTPGLGVIEGTVNVVPVGLVDSLELRPDLFISTWALSESSTAAQEYVAARNWFGARHLLLAYQKPMSASFVEGSVMARIVAESGASRETPELQLRDEYAFR